MKSFELTFRCHYADDHQAGEQGEFSQIIAAGDIHLALHIAQAMVGAQIDQGLWLGERLCVERTDKLPTPFPWNSDRLWLKILHKLGLFSGKYYDSRIRFISNVIDDRDGLQIVGFHIWDPYS